MSQVTRILSAIEQGDPHGAEQLLPLVYGELRKLAARRLTRQSPGQTFQPTALATLMVGSQEDFGAGKVGFGPYPASSVNCLSLHEARGSAKAATPTRRMNLWHRAMLASAFGL